MPHADALAEPTPKADALAEPQQQADIVAEFVPHADVVARVEQAGKKRKILIEHTSQQVTYSPLCSCPSNPWQHFVMFSGYQSTNESWLYMHAGWQTG